MDIFGSSRTKRMNSNYNSGLGGTSIIPSARRSIHDHDNCPFDYKVMGKYGLSGNARNTTLDSGSSSPSNNRGVDVVDNAMSKHAHMSSPIPAQRRKSLPLLSPQHTDDSSDDELAKSLPATILPYSHCSDSPTYKHLHNSSGTSANNDLGKPEPFSLNYLSTNRGDQPTTVESEPKIPDGKEPENCSVLLLVLGIIVAIVAVGSLGYEWPNTTDPFNIYDEPRFYKELNELGQRFSISEDSILQVQTGISTIFEKKDASSFIFIYNSNGIRFDRIMFNDFMDSVASAAARYLRNDSTSVQQIQHLVVESSQLDMQNHSELINEYREDVSKTGVMLVKELDRVPSALAMAFHFFCDEYNPLVEKSAIFFTLDIVKCSASGKQQPTHTYIEQCLKKKWNGVPENNIGPLLTRVVGTVVDVTSV